MEVNSKYKIMCMSVITYNNRHMKNEPKNMSKIHKSDLLDKN